MSSLLGVGVDSGGCLDSDGLKAELRTLGKVAGWTPVVFDPFGGRWVRWAWIPVVSLCSTDRLMAFKPLAWENGTLGGLTTDCEAVKRSRHSLG